MTNKPTMEELTKEFDKFEKEQARDFKETLKWCRKHGYNIVASEFEPTLAKFVEWLGKKNE